MVALAGTPKRSKIRGVETLQEVTDAWRPGRLVPWVGLYVGERFVASMGGVWAE